MEMPSKEEGKIIGILSTEFTVADGNEAFHDFLEGRRCFPLPQMMKEEDRERFMMMVETLEKDGGETVVRMLDHQNQYQWYYLHLKKIQTEAQKSFYQLEMNAIGTMEACLNVLERLKGQYERFLGMQNGMYFLYSHENGMLHIFWINENHRHVMLEKKLDEWEESSCQNGCFQAEEEAVFHMLCKDIRTGTDRFVHDISSTLFSNEEKLYRFRGGSWQKRAELAECYGTVQRLDKKTKRIKIDSSLEEQLDPLTGLYNKRTCMKKLRKLIEEEQEAVCTICMIDIDNFKSLNDTYGHLFGDRVLTIVADTMREVLGNRGSVGRFGGDEFFIIIDCDLNEQEIRQILFTIRKNIRWYFENSEDQLVVTLSVGTAAYPKDAHGIDELFAKADRALYIAKEKGKDRYIIYDEEKHGRVTFDMEHRKIVELSRQKKKESDTTTVVTEIYDLLEQKGIEGIDEVMGYIGKAFSIDRILIFRNSDLLLWKGWGYEIWHQDDASYVLQDEYLNNFDGHKVDACSGIEQRKYKYSKTYDYLNKLEIKSMLQYIVGEGTDMSGLISYEMCKIRRKWSDEDVHNLTLISHFIERQLLKDDERQAADRVQK